MTIGEAATNVVARLEQERMPAQSGEGAAMLSMIERAARDPAVDVEKFERLMLMRERVEKEAARKAFNAAMAAAKGEIPTISKNRKVDFTTAKGRTNYVYEDLAEIADTIDPILQKHGLAYRFRSAQEGGKVRVTCVVSHDAGHYEETTLEAGEDHSGNKNGIQAVGSSATFLQRYTLKLAFGLAAAKDDDGRAAGVTKSSADLIAEGEEVAAKGKSALEIWWTKALTQDQRVSVGADTIKRLKEVAANAKVEAAQ